MTWRKRHTVGQPQLFFYILVHRRPRMSQAFVDMSSQVPTRLKGHVVALPFPTTGHVNPMMNLCKFLVSRTTDVTITFVVTQEWLSHIGSYPKPPTIRFATIPNVVPFETKILDDMPLFSVSVRTKMRAAFEELLDHQLIEPPTVIVTDVELTWPTAVANQRNIPVALLWTMSASFFCTYRQLDILAPAPDRRLTVDLLDKQAEQIQGSSSSQQPINLRKLVHEKDFGVFKRALDCIPPVAKTDYLLLNTIQELEAEEINFLKAKFPFRIYPVGPAIPFTELEPPSDSSATDSEHVMKWLDCQPKMSVLYISMGSLFSMSRPQMEELASALKTSEIQFLWACRSDAAWLKEKCGDKGLVVPWCDQLKVLCHRSIVGFWSHGGWNSTVEACFAGVPILGYPFFLDQFSNCRQIVKEWKNGWKVGGEGSEELVKKEEILKALGMAMDAESEEGKEIRDKARQLKILCRGAIAKGGSLVKNLDAFVEDIVGASSDSVHQNHWSTS
ncbi:UDP-glycosyltransferase 87A1-like isoform X2 [Prosopis cineraria]|uniref:UDP-glycosyltransferase 87A1-like isoform X2 n=1 Tax=Prosopis cineraria TaxID=364024 RepID=UPI00240EBD89|nr:UDP-glycosyltransferase 87A1-like isoform X2 [Prosopis cineraria]